MSAFTGTIELPPFQEFYVPRTFKVFSVEKPGSSYPLVPLGGKVLILVEGKIKAVDPLE